MEKEGEKKIKKSTKGGERGFCTHEFRTVRKLALVRKMAPVRKLAPVRIFAQCEFLHPGANFPALFFFHSSSTPDF